jgi:hypothetical protein
VIAFSAFNPNLKQLTSGGSTLRRKREDGTAASAAEFTRQQGRQRRKREDGTAASAAEFTRQQGRQRRKAFLAGIISSLRSL